jgi:hypothetical protein
MSQAPGFVQRQRIRRVYWCERTRPAITSFHATEDNMNESHGNHGHAHPHPTPGHGHAADHHAHPQHHPSALRGAPIAPKLAPVDDTPIALIEDEEVVPSSNKKIVAYGAGIDHKHHEWRRVPNQTGRGACRVKSFHGKYSEQGLEFLDNSINEWLDAHGEIEVKFVTSTVMTFEGKVREPALVLNVWY